MIRAFIICVLVPMFVMYTMVQLFIICSDVNNIRYLLTTIVEHMAPDEPEEPKLDPTVPVIDTRIIDEGFVDEPMYEVKALVDNLLELSGLTAEELELGLLGDLKPYAACFVQAEADTGVNAIFLASVAALESGWCTSRAAIEYHNLFGWNIYDSNMIGLDISSFDSKEQCIAHVAQRLRDMYLTPTTGQYFEGYSVDAVNTHYNGSQEWAESIKEIMLNIAERINNEL